MTLVEAIITVLVSAMFMITTISGISRAQRVTTTSQNQLIAMNIAQEVIDACRNIPISTLSSYAANNASFTLGNYNMAGNIPNNAQNYPAIFQRPAILDLNIADMQWNNTNINTLFNPTVTVSVSNSVQYSNSVIVTVTVNWSDGTGSQSYQSSTSMSSSGIHMNG